MTKTELKKIINKKFGFATNERQTQKNKTAKCFKAIQRLAKRVEKRCKGTHLSGAVLLNGKTYLCDKYIMLAINEELKELPIAPKVDLPLRYEELLSGVERVCTKEITVDINSIKEIARNTKKKDTPESIVTLDEESKTYVDSHRFREAVDCLVNPKVYVYPIAPRTIYITGDNGRGLICPIKKN